MLSIILIYKLSEKRTHDHKITKIKYLYKIKQKKITKNIINLAAIILYSDLWYSVMSFDRG